MTDLLLTVLFCVLSAPAAIAGTTYHVRTDGDDTNCTGLHNAGYTGGGLGSACAYKTIAKAISSVTGAGNTVLIHAAPNSTVTFTECTTFPSGADSGWGGTIAIPSGKAGASDSYNVIKAANDGIVTLAGGGSCGRAVYVNSSYWRIGGLASGEGFVIEDGYTLAKPTNYHDGLIYLAENASYVKVYGNQSKGQTVATTTDVYEVGAVVFKRWCTGCELKKNTITLKKERTGIKSDAKTCGSDCSNCPVVNWVISENRFIADPAYSVLPAPSKTIVFINGSNTVLVDSNYFEFGNVSNHINVSTPQILYNRQNCNWTVQNNYFQMNAATGVVNWMQESTGPVDNNRHRYYNNTVYGRADWGFLLDDCDDCEVRNNNFVGYSSGSRINQAIRLAYSGCSGSSPFTGRIGYNNFYNVTSRYENWCGTETDERASDLAVDPQFTGSGDFPVPFLTLQATSPVRARGCDQDRICGAGPRSDFDRDPRDVPGDIGADEIRQGADANPASVTNCRRTDVTR